MSLGAGRKWTGPAVAATVRLWLELMEQVVGVEANRLAGWEAASCLYFATAVVTAVLTYLHPAPPQHAPTTEPAQESQWPPAAPHS